MIAYHRFVVAASLCSFLLYFLFVAFEGAQPAARRKYGIINKHNLPFKSFLLNVDSATFKDRNVVSNCRCKVFVESDELSNSPESLGLFPILLLDIF